QGGAPHAFRFRTPEGETVEGEAGWVVDASGRNKVLQKKLGLGRRSPIRHGATFAWVDGLLDIERLTDLSPPERRLPPAPPPPRTLPPPPPPHPHHALGLLVLGHPPPRPPQPGAGLRRRLRAVRRGLLGAQDGRLDLPPLPALRPRPGRTQGDRCRGL